MPLEASGPLADLLIDGGRGADVDIADTDDADTDAEVSARAEWGCSSLRKGECFFRPCLCVYLCDCACGVERADKGVVAVAAAEDDEVYGWNCLPR